MEHTPAFAQYLARKAEQDADRGSVTGAAAREVTARGSFSAAADAHEEVNPMYSSKGNDFLSVL